MFRYISGVLAVALFVVGGYAKLLSYRVDGLTVDNLAIRADLRLCEITATNLTEDRISDAEVDNIPTGNLNIVPDHWLREVRP